MVANFGKKQKGDSVANKPVFQIVGIFILLMIVILLIADVKIYQKKRELVQRIDDYKKQIEDIKKSSQTLKSEIANSDNVDYLEKIAYEQLNKQKPGEQEIIFIAPPEDANISAKPANFWDTKTWFGWMGQSWNWLKSKI